MAAEEYKSNQYSSRVRFDDGVLERIHDSEYWKETCSTVTADNIFDVANQLTFVGGAYAKSKEVAPFLCLLAKMLQLEPEIEKVIGCIDTPSSSVYARALCAVYVRLTCDAVQCYLNLEKFHFDLTPVKKLRRDGKMKTCYMFNITDSLIRDDSFFCLSAQRLPMKRDLEREMWIRSLVNDMVLRTVTESQISSPGLDRPMSPEGFPSPPHPHVPMSPEYFPGSPDLDIPMSPENPQFVSGRGRSRPRRISRSSSFSSPRISLNLDSPRNSLSPNRNGPRSPQNFRNPIELRMPHRRKPQSPYSSIGPTCRRRYCSDDGSDVGCSPDVFKADFETFYETENKGLNEREYCLWLVERNLTKLKPRKKDFDRHDFLCETDVEDDYKREKDMEKLNNDRTIWRTMVDYGLVDEEGHHSGDDDDDNGVMVDD